LGVNKKEEKGNSEFFG